MENWLKGLIAVACCIVIAAGGYFAWGEYSSYRLRSEVAAGRDGARVELFNLANAEPYEIDKVRAFCKTMSDKRYRDNDNTDFVRILVRNCSALGYS